MRKVKSRLLIVSMFVAPVVVFLLVLNWKVGLVPLVGMDAICAKCERKATRTLASAASALRSKGVYLYDKTKYSKLPPVWCENHGPEPASENAGRAYASALGAFGVAVAVYKGAARRAD